MANDMEMSELLDIAKSIPRIRELHQKRDELQAQVNAVDREIKSLLLTGVLSGRQPGASGTSAHPNKGTIGYDIVEILRQTDSMSREQIQDALKQKRGGRVNPHTVRSYLTNFKCFQRVRKNTWRYDAGV